MVAAGQGVRSPRIRDLAQEHLLWLVCGDVRSALAPGHLLLGVHIIQGVSDPIFVIVTV